MVLDGVASANGFLGLFLVGLATPLTAVCVLPLYPAFISYLGSAGEERSVAVLGLSVVSGVLAFVASVGILFGFVLESPIGAVVQTASPVAFGILAVVGIVLLIVPNGFSRLPAVEPPQSEYPILTAFGYGFFFGAIVIPCNPGLIGLLFASSPVLFDSHLESFVGFLLFGIGMSAPLLAFAVLSEPFSRRVTSTIARYGGPINRAVGAVLLGVSAYYLVNIFGVGAF